MQTSSTSIRVIGTVTRVLAAAASLAAMAMWAPSSAKAWDPLDAAACLAFPKIVPTPSNLNVCEEIVKEASIGAITEPRISCGCQPLDLANPFSNCFGRPPQCAIPGSCILDPLTCIVVQTHVPTILGYVFNWDELTCDLTGITAEDMLNELALEGFDTLATALLTGALAGGNFDFYNAAKQYLNVLECNFAIPLPEALKAVMRGMRNESTFQKETTFFDADLDDVRLMRESDFPLGIPQSGLTLGHLVIVEDEDFEILKNWAYDLAYVKSGALCPLERDALALISHESVHVRQYRNLTQEDFVQRYLADLIYSKKVGKTFEDQAYLYGLQNAYIDRTLASYEPGASNDVGCPGVPTPPPPPGTVATTPAIGGAPAVSIVSMCGGFANACAPGPIECSGNHSATVNFVGTATDVQGIKTSDWRLLQGSTSTVIGTGNTLTRSFESKHGSVTGIYQIGFGATDNETPAKTATVAAPLFVHDTLLPVVFGNVAPPTYECKRDTYTERGGSATDLCDPAVATTPVTISGSVNTAITGTYTVTYSAIDDAMNVGMATRTVEVVDTVPPTITAPPSIVTQDRTPALGTPIATDLCTTPAIFNDAPLVFPYGNTLVTWWSRDAAGLESARATQLVTVLGADANAAGHDLSCGLSRDGEVYCWGANDAGQVGDGANVDRWAPLAINMTGTARQVSVGSRHVCAVKDDRTVQCWGSGADYRLGNGSTANRNTPVTVSSLSNVLQVSAGGGQAGLLFVDDGHTCAVLENGGVRCWGENAKGQLGNASTTDAPTPVIAQMPTASIAIQVTAGGEHSCAIAIDTVGRAYCWGEGADGRLGTGNTTDRNKPTLVSFPSGVTPVQIDAGERHTCAVDQLGSVWCWGDNANGRLGNNSYTDSSVPVRVTLPASAVQVSAGLDHTCAVLVDGRAYCWGTPLNGRLGDGVVIVDQLVPIRVAGLTNAIQISAGKDHTCARTYDGSALRDVCWGDNANGELGDGTWFSRATAVQVSTLCASAGTFPAAGGSFSSCTIGLGASAPPNAMCWGANASGQLGDGTTERHYAPAVALNTADARVTAVGESHACALTSSGRVRCWGDNSFGQLGDGTRTARPAPTLISDTTTYVFVATGGNFSCGVTTTNQVKCWGANLNGQLGDGTNTDRLAATQVISLPGQPLYLDLGHDHSCAVVQNGATSRQIWCWGANTHGQLGNNSFLDNWTPVRAGTIADAWLVSAGAVHTCASTQSGPIYCWGHNVSGQLGIGSTSDSWVPARVINTSGAQLSVPFASISAGGRHSCAAPVGATQQAACWGNNTSGQLGIGSTVQSTRAQLVPGMPFVSSVSAGDEHTCARPGGSGMKCWGNNSTGQLGDGTSLNRTLPVQVAGACY